MEHPDLAHFACVAAAVGAVLLIAGHGRIALLLGLVALAGGEIGLAVAGIDLERLDALESGAGLLGAAFAVGALLGAAWVFVRRPAWVAPAVLFAAPLRPPITIESGGGFPIAIAEGGQLGRLLPLYFVLAAAALALAWRAARGVEAAAHPLPRVAAVPTAAFIGFACLSLLWADDLDAGVELLAFFLVPFGLLFACVGRAPLPEWMPRRLGQIAVALGAVFALVGLYQAATKELFFFAPNLEISNANSDFFRVTSLFGDPSLYGRHLVLAMTVLLVVLALKRVDARAGILILALLWAGLFFSYSQSSMVALVAVTLAVAAATGTRRVRLFVGAGFAAVALLGAGYLTVAVVSGESLQRETADRSKRIEDTARVVRDAPVAGVGIGGQARASRRLSGRDRPTPAFVSHMAPLTVAAELGVIGLALYAWLLVGGVRMLLAVRRLEDALGLALLAALLGLFVHALFYPGFFEDPLVWVVLALGAASLTWTRRDDGAHPEHRPHPQTSTAAA